MVGLCWAPTYWTPETPHRDNQEHLWTLLNVHVENGDPHASPGSSPRSLRCAHQHAAARFSVQGGQLSMSMDISGLGRQRDPQEPGQYQLPGSL